MGGILRSGWRRVLFGWRRILCVGWRRAVLLLLLAFMAGPALCIGLHDAFDPVSLTAFLDGAVDVAAGLCILAGVWELARPFWTNRVEDHNYGLASFLAAATSAYVAASIAISAYGYRPWYVYFFGFYFLVSCAIAAAVVRDEHVHVLTSAMRSSFLAGSTLVAVASFVYQDIYVPSNSEVGIEFVSSAGRPLKISHDLYLIPVHLTMTDRSSVGVVVATSLATVTGVYYAGHGRRYAASAAAQQREIAEGEQAGQLTQAGADLSDVFPGREHRTVLAATTLIEDGSQLAPGGTSVRSFVVVVPRYNFKSLAIEQSIVYGSNQRLVLTANEPLYGPITKVADGCTHDVQRRWALRESELRSFTRGQQILVTNWCADRGRERASAFVENKDGKTSAAIRKRYKGFYGLHQAMHTETVTPP